MDRLQVEIDRNYDWFQRNLKQLLASHSGEFAVLRDQSVQGYFESPGEAFRTALAKFPDRIFSIQQVVDEPLDLGFLSLAVD
ncbi:MAG TPA: hypothetical protein PKD99_14690 [Sphingopyxis sp.]|nr:hypothetical protein [Sphingopyxis sp.]HMP46347.1 hypothetical protein [Sphingopyxis sp.]HMQ17983.1 hypothetical protein [Sphingopyxis sp.]